CALYQGRRKKEAGRGGSKAEQPGERPGGERRGPGVTQRARGPAGAAAPYLNGQAQPCPWAPANRHRGGGTDARCGPSAARTDELDGGKGGGEDLAWKPERCARALEHRLELLTLELEHFREHVLSLRREGERGPLALGNGQPATLGVDRDLRPRLQGRERQK